MGQHRGLDPQGEGGGGRKLSEMDLYDLGEGLSPYPLDKLSQVCRKGQHVRHVLQSLGPRLQAARRRGGRRRARRLRAATTRTKGGVDACISALALR